MKRDVDTERSLLLDCIRHLKSFKVNEDIEDPLILVSRILEINDLSDNTKLEIALKMLREDDEDDYMLDEVEDLVNETILDLEFLVQQKVNKI